MAPVTVFGQINYSKEHLTPTHKMRKPLVEKVRRDRINLSIEQLKALLGPEFLRQHSDSKQEKADILEMAVTYLRCRNQQKQQSGFAAPTASGNGYSRCVQEAIGFLSQCEVKKTPSHGQLLNHFHSLQVSGKRGHESPRRFPLSSPPGSPLHKAGRSKGAKGPADCLLWRPW